MWSRTAVWAFTGTLTSPKLMVPFQTGLAMAVVYPAGTRDRTSAGPGPPPGRNPIPSGLLAASRTLPWSDTSTGSPR